MSNELPAAAEALSEATAEAIANMSIFASSLLINSYELSDQPPEAIRNDLAAISEAVDLATSSLGTILRAAIRIRRNYQGISS